MQDISHVFGKISRDFERFARFLRLFADFEENYFSRTAYYTSNAGVMTLQVRAVTRIAGPSCRTRQSSSVPAPAGHREGSRNRALRR